MTGLPDQYANAVQFTFGDSPELADELLALVLSGTKTATCGALEGYGDDEPFPVVGRRDVVLDGKGRPACVIETTEVTIRSFSAVDARFAADEGEGDRSLDYWRAAHQAFFERNGGFSEDMLLACERFKLIETFSAPAN